MDSIPEYVTPRMEQPEKPVQMEGEDYKLLSQEEKVEFRDEHGNLLSPEQVKELEGKVSFQTRYETRTRLVDAQGNEIHQPVAPPHPDAEGQNPETKEAEGEKVPRKEQPPTVEAAADLGKEKSATREEKRSGEAKPGSEREEATARGAKM